MIPDVLLTPLPDLPCHLLRAAARGSASGSRQEAAGQRQEGVWNAGWEHTRGAEWRRRPPWPYRRVTVACTLGVSVADLAFVALTCAAFAVLVALVAGVAKS